MYLLKGNFELAWNCYLYSQIGAKLQWKKQLKYSGLILTSLAGKVRYTHSAWLVLTFSFIHKPGSHTFSLVLTLSSWLSLCQSGTYSVNLLLASAWKSLCQTGTHFSLALERVLVLTPSASYSLLHHRTSPNSLVVNQSVFKQHNGIHPTSLVLTPSSLILIPYPHKTGCHYAGYTPHINFIFLVLTLPPACCTAHA